MLTFNQRLVKYLKIRKIYSYDNVGALLEYCGFFHTMGWGDKEIIKWLDSLEDNLNLDGILKSILDKKKELLEEFSIDKIPTLVINESSLIAKSVTNREEREHLYLLWLSYLSKEENF